MRVLATEAAAQPQLPRRGCKAQIHSFLSLAQQNVCQQIKNYRGEEIVKTVLQYEFEIETFALLCKELKTPSKQAPAVYVK